MSSAPHKAPDEQQPDAAQSNGQQDTRNGNAHDHHKAIPAQVTLLYESRDGKLCLFEDAHGHITAVRASQLA